VCAGKNIILMTGAGTSCDSGIPDFRFVCVNFDRFQFSDRRGSARSPGTGLYDNLQKYDLPTPQSIFDIEYVDLICWGFHEV
jgi:NAD-dependent deacetylase sirtuin 2